MALNPKQQAFVREYLVSLNATQAAIAAGYSVATAKQQGSRLLTHADVKAALAGGTARKFAKLEVKAENVLAELLTFAHSDPIELFTKEGVLKHLEDMPESTRRSIKSLEFEELFEGASGEKFCKGRTVKITLWDKPKGLELLGKHLKLFTDKIEVEGKLTLEQLVEQAAAKGKPA